jgi:transposase
VLRIETETNIERLRQVAILLERENAKLYRRLEHLTDLLAKAEGKDAVSLQLEIQYLKEILARQTQAIFGRSSEKTTREKTNEEREAKPKRGHGPTDQPNLPIVDVVCELDPTECRCRDCGGEMGEMDGQFEESEEIDVVERSFRILRIKRKKYRCSCGTVIQTAPGPEKLIPGGRYSVGFATAVAIAKYADHMPLARQVRQMARAGLNVTTQTLWDQLFALGKHLGPSYQALRSVVLSAPVIGADETTWQMMDDSGSKRWWAWSISSEEAVYHHIHGSRSSASAEAILGPYEGTIVCDGYTAYGALAKKRANAREGPAPPRLAHCWAHVRRKFIEAEVNDERATKIRSLIDGLFVVEAEARTTGNGDLRARRAELRQERSRGIVEEIRRMLLAEKVLPRSAIGRAVLYTDHLWTGLCRFLGDPDIPIDNNGAERALRGIAIGRKNHYGSRSLRGTHVAALCYSLIESAKLVGVEPGEYLREATRRALQNPGAVTLPRDLL